MWLIEWLVKRLYHWQWCYGQMSAVLVVVAAVVLADVVAPPVPVVSFVVDAAD